MLAELKQRPNVRYVIVYMMSRAFRNALEELTTKAQLSKMGITLVSAKENFGDGYLGDAMQGIMAIFNELQVRSNGEDVKVKMPNKARNGGTVGLAWSQDNPSPTPTRMFVGSWMRATRLS